MLDSDTTRKLREMKLGEIIDIVDAQNHIPESYGLAFEDRLRQIVDDLYLIKQDNRIKRLAKRAKFRWPTAEIPSIQFLPERHLNRDLILGLPRCTFVKSGLSASVYGAPSSGKSYIACAIGKAACRQEYKVKYIRMGDMYSKLAEYDRKDEIMRYAKRLNNNDLLILDEWLSSPPTGSELDFIFELVEKRAEDKSTIICGLYEPAMWCERMGSSAQSESIVERLIHTPINIDCGDFNMREYLAKHEPKPWC